MKQKGFTLIELLVVMAIFTVITSIVLVRNSRFNDTIELTNLAYDVALSIREAQVFGLSAKESGIGADDFTKAYGVRFAIARPEEYDFYVDLNGDRTAGVGGVSNEEVLETIKIGKGHFISEICATVSGVQKCSSDSGLAAFNVTYLRPNPEGFVSTNLGEASDMKIILSSPLGNTRELFVSSTGQISVR